MIILFKNISNIFFKPIKNIKKLNKYLNKFLNKNKYFINKILYSV